MILHPPPTLEFTYFKIDLGKKNAATADIYIASLFLVYLIFWHLEFANVVIRKISLFGPPVRSTVGPRKSKSMLVGWCVGVLVTLFTKYQYKVKSRGCPS